MPPLPSPLRSPLTGSEEQRRDEERRRRTRSAPCRQRAPGAARASAAAADCAARAPAATADDASSGSGGGRRKVRQPPPGAALSLCGGPCSSSGARPSPSPLRPPDLRPLLLLRRAAPFLSSPAVGSVGPDPPSPAGGRIRPAAAGSRRWSHHVPALPFFPAGRAHWGTATATATNSSFGARRRRWRGIWLLRRRLLVVAVVAVCWWQHRAATGRAAVAGVRAAAGVWPGPIFYLLFIYFAVCRKLRRVP